MLVLARKVGEEIVILKDGYTLGRVVLVDIKGEGRAKIGFDLPPNYDIRRREVFERSRSEQDDVQSRVDTES